MKKNLYSFLIALCFFYLTPQLSAQFTKKSFGHVISMEIPDYMTRTIELNSSAIVQYQNTKKETYLVLIEDSKEEMELAGIKSNLNDFFNEFISDYTAEFENYKSESVTEFTLGNLSCKQGNFTFKSGEVDIYMIATIIESRQYFYKMLTWTLAKNKNIYKKDFDKIIKSFEEN
jgi:hypothetical protein